MGIHIFVGLTKPLYHIINFHSLAFEAVLHRDANVLQVVGVAAQSTQGLKTQ